MSNALLRRFFLIRERTSTEGKPGPDDRLVRAFDVRHDAYMYADSLNEKQRKLDEHDDHRTQHAI